MGSKINRREIWFVLCGRTIKNLVMVLLFIIIIIELIVVFNLFKTFKETNLNTIDEGKIDSNQSEITNSIQKVRERNNFYTVVACVNKYLNSLYKQEQENLYGYLDSSYIEKNNITKTNILSKIDVLDKDKTFSAKQMYEQKISDNITKYFAYGIIKEDLEEGISEEEEFYISIKIDSSIGTFSVLPNTYIN